MSFKAKAYNWASHNPHHALGLGGAVVGGAYGAALPHFKNTQDAIHRVLVRNGFKPGTKKYEDAKRKATKHTSILMGGFGAATYGGLGYTTGKLMKSMPHRSGNHQYDEAYKDYYRKQYRARGGSGPRPPKPSNTVEEMRSHLDLSGREKTKAEVKKKYREMAMKHHPDRGGDVNKMKKITNAWTELQNSDWFNKLAFYRGFHKAASKK